MKSRKISLALFAATGLLAGGCANDGSNALSTASVTPDKLAAAQSQPKVDPVCMSLASQIDTLRKEGTVERLEKAASGKSSSVQVKRTALAKQTELNKANAEFQTRCGPALPKAQSAQAPAAPVAAVAATAPPVGKPMTTSVAPIAAATAVKAATQ